MCLFYYPVLICLLAITTGCCVGSFHWVIINQPPRPLLRRIRPPPYPGSLMHIFIFMMFPFYVAPPPQATRMHIFIFMMFPFYVGRNIIYQHMSYVCRLFSHFLVTYDLYNIASGFDASFFSLGKTNNPCLIRFQFGWHYVWGLLHNPFDVLNKRLIKVTHMAEILHYTLNSLNIFWVLRICCWSVEPVINM